jgi:hypothetical protein
VLSKLRILVATFFVALSSLAPAAPTLVGPIGASPGLPGGTRAALQVNATGVIKLGPSILVRIIVQSPGSGGSLTINDTDSIGDAAVGNEIFSVASSELIAGQSIVLKWPIGTGIVISAVPTGSSFSISIS